ncbi:hypothetical protein T10_8860 [Trichinella papuae]|uniref:Uncharacterized protein n=1 Tax=Trichinella papuae TaxID=268474 RepID=A0A0V1LYL2_9BILA|nr:hypothetical protein T10_8860 [Trichinella papuae]
MGGVDTLDKLLSINVAALRLYSKLHQGSFIPLFSTRAWSLS